MIGKGLYVNSIDNKLILNRQHTRVSAYLVRSTDVTIGPKSYASTVTFKTKTYKMRDTDVLLNAAVHLISYSGVFALPYDFDDDVDGYILVYANLINMKEYAVTIPAGTSISDNSIFICLEFFTGNF